MQSIRVYGTCGCKAVSELSSNCQRIVSEMSETWFSKYDILNTGDERSRDQNSTHLHKESTVEYTTQFVDQYLDSDVDDSETYSPVVNNQNLDVPSDLTKSGKVKWLHKNYPDLTIRQIADEVGIRYQFAYNVVHKK